MLDGLTSCEVGGPIPLMTRREIVHATHAAMLPFDRSLLCWALLLGHQQPGFVSNSPSTASLNSTASQLFSHGLLVFPVFTRKQEGISDPDPTAGQGHGLENFSM